MGLVLAVALAVKLVLVARSLAVEARRGGPLAVKFVLVLLSAPGLAVEGSPSKSRDPARPGLYGASRRARRSPTVATSSR